MRHEEANDGWARFLDRAAYTGLVRGRHIAGYLVGIPVYLPLGFYLVAAVISRGWDVRAWTLLGVLVLIAAVQIGTSFRQWWSTNLLRNRLDAQRRLRREARGTK
jgi:hypothetical protein